MKLEEFASKNRSRQGFPCGVASLPKAVRIAVESSRAKGIEASAVARWLQAEGHFLDRAFGGLSQTVRRHLKGECRCGQG